MATSKPHYYNAEGVLVSPGTPGAFVSPTTILGIRANSGLQEWRDRVGAEAADSRSKEATDRGTAVHNMVETFLQDGEFQINEGDELYPYFQGFMNWYTKYKPETVAIEAFCRSEKYGFAGRVDYICHIDGELWIIDWKTSRNIHQGYELQLAAYRQAWKEMTRKTAKTKVVQLTSELKRGYREKAMDGNINVFLAHKEVYDYAVRIGEISLPAPPWDGGLIYA